MFTVTRQRQWPDGDNVVEVSHGGRDYCNPDALSAKYAGEFEEFADPRAAVETAIEIVRQWRKDAPSGERIALGVGDTHGMTLPFSPSTFRYAREWAKQAWAKLPKCSGCGEPMPDSKRQYWRANDWDGLDYCGEDCATRAAEHEAEQQAELEQEESE